MSVSVWHAHGLGNDYLVWEGGTPLSQEQVRALCDRKEGVGADGVLEPRDSSEADHGVRIWNPDGSVAEKSGNGLRIFAVWLAENRDAGTEFTVHTGTDRVSCWILEDTVRVAMGRATSQPEAIPVRVLTHERPFTLGEETVRVTAVGMGNPYAVIFVTDPLDEVPWRRWGRLLEEHPDFPNRTNVQVARMVDRTTIEARIWERGAGETQASGSSACAVVAAAAWTGRGARGEVRVRMPGGTLKVTLSSEEEVMLEGPVEAIGRVVLDEEEWAGI